MNTKKENTTPEKSILIKLITIISPFILGVTILYFLFYNIDLDELWQIIKKADWFILIWSLIFGLAANTIKALRWQLFFKALNLYPQKKTLILATWGSYAVNYLIPRAGEVWKCIAVANTSKIPFNKTLGTSVIDRIFDSIAVLLICCFTFFTNIDFFIEQISKNDSFFDQIFSLLKSPFFYASLILLSLIIFIVFYFFSSHKQVVKIKKIFSGIIVNLILIWRMKSKWLILVYTICTWVCYFLFFYVTFFAFNFTKDLGLMAGLTAFSLSTLSLIIPTQGGLGPWQVAVIAALTLYNVDYIEATAFATGVFIIQSLWVICWGAFGIIILGILSKRQIKFS